MPKGKPWGYSSIKDSPGDKKAIDAISDASKKRKRLERVAADNLKRAAQGKKSRSVKQATKDGDLAGKIQITRYRMKAEMLRTRALQVKQSGTGNEAARKTYLKAAAEYDKKVAALQAKQKASK